MSRPTSILLVCMGNICRSPLAEGILRQRALEAGVALEVDSAGTHAYHVGNPPDPRARQIGRSRGTPIDALRARQVEAADFERFDHILVADQANLANLRERFPLAAERAELLLAFAGVSPEQEVPDPYFGDDAGFEEVFELLDRAAAGLLRRLAKPA